MDKAEMLRSLRLFNEKAEKLAFNRFTNSVLDQESGVTIRASMGEPLTVQRRGPDYESIELFVLTLRFFMQDKDGCSLRCMVPIYEAALVSDELKNAFFEARQTLNDYLESETMFTIDDKRLTHRDILETFVYGDIAHANPGKRDRYDAWMSHDGLPELLRNDLVVVLATFMRTIAYIHDLNAKVIVAMGETP